MNLRNAVTRSMKEWDTAKATSTRTSSRRHLDMDCLPPSLAGRRYYHPTNHGSEKRIAERLEEIRRLRSK